MLNQVFYVEGIFDSEIPTATKLRRGEYEEDQVQPFLRRKGGSSELSVYTNVETMCITSSAVLTKQKIQLEKEAKENNGKTQNTIYVRIKKLQAAMKENIKILKGEELKVMDLKNVLMDVFPSPELSDNSSIFTKKTGIKKETGSLRKIVVGIYSRSHN